MFNQKYYKLLRVFAYNTPDARVACDPNNGVAMAMDVSNPYV
ncbi:hypothetical protein SAMN04489841_1793 [Natrinema salaciae]|uniref:Uncharacterized protein n=1 Tax=Natrinema salaciae TaxID=1186196 RepID=A0A1H9G684_9EURY|nr:hypothetical protein SAMN04489841_1793 [Natrinema salaciae]